jgi:transcriptional regulator with XRE-family HTH domain
MPCMAKASATISEQLREAIESAGMTRYALAKATGVSESQLSRFVNGTSGLGVEAIDKLCAYLGLHLAAIESKPKTKTKG